MVALNANISIIILNANVLNTPIEKAGKKKTLQNKFVLSTK